MYEIYKRLLEEKGVKTVDVCNATGIQQNVISNWKSRDGGLSLQNAQKIADYFEVPISYLIHGTMDKQTRDALYQSQKNGNNHEKSNDKREHYIDPETALIAQEIVDNKELSLLFNTARDASPEDLQIVHGMLLALKRKEQNG